MVYNYANLYLILVYRGEYCQMKKCLTFCILAIFAVSLTACSGTNTASSSTDAATQAVVTTAAPTQAPTEATEYKIHIPYSYFGGVPDDDDLVLTNSDKEYGITAKEKVATGGMLITVEKDKYDQLLEMQKNKLIDLIESSKVYSIVDRIEYNDDFSEIVEYRVPEEVEEPDDTPNENVGPTCAPGSTVSPNTFNPQIFYESVYYQAIYNKNDGSQNIICTHIVKENDGTTISTDKFPND